MNRWLIGISLSLILLIAGCASSPPSTGDKASKNSTGASSYVGDRLYFGRDSPAGEVTVQQWNEFLRTVVTPRFPEGLTHWEAAGQWQSRETNAIGRENTFVLELLHPPSRESDRRIEEIMRLYKAKFQQESVLWTRDRDLETRFR